jgi:hypothetical protein
LCEEVNFILAIAGRLELDDKVPDHSTFSVNRHGRFGIATWMFEAVVRVHGRRSGQGVCG